MSDARIAMLWDLLTSLAAKKQKTTYGKAASQIGGIARGLGATLRPIQAHCKAKGLPNLTVLVVQAGTGRQGEGFADDPESEMARVFAQDWSEMGNPFVERKS